MIIVCCRCFLKSFTFRLNLSPTV
uniref:Uncharacterized protein n=1 Tax=Anguilla anguilla TaxID=7936 RepID=A0A0E9V3E8_ANGAN